MKGNNLTNALLIVLIALVIVLGGFYTYTYFEGNKEENNNSSSDANTDINTTSQITDLDINSTLVQSLASKVIGIYTNKTLSSYNDYFYKQGSLDLSTTDKTFRLSLVAESIKTSIEYNDIGCTDNRCGVYYVSEDAIKNAYQSLFNDTYTRGTFNVAMECGVSFSFNSSNNRYEGYYSAGCGDLTDTYTLSQLGYAKEIVTNDSDIIELYEYYAKLRKGNYYSDYGEINIITTFTTDMSDSEFFAKYKDQSGVYKYTFEKDSSGNYYFTKVEKVK